MAKSSSFRNLVAVGFGAAALRLLGSTFVPAGLHAAGPQAAPVQSTGSAATAGVIGFAAAAGATSPAYAEEGLLNFGKVKLGGGFALNLDIPETGLVNIVVLIGGLLYLLGPLLSNSMETREKEINQDISDAIAKWEEANARLAEAQKNEAQAQAVISEIEASIDKDKADFKKSVEEQTSTQLARQAAATESLLKGMQDAAADKVEAYIERNAVERGVKDLMEMKAGEQAKFMDRAIASL
eukprot:TRINITY_DN1039_c0_g4_i1.p1 TRINITY_DN1039_c0_g4~~TRINITY_DN1039_c0_g4_i1.p1  ORF type:complete len:240 (-),score=95.99 TRINITY_DN1039_c0_g4_i1:120-839(-)